MDNMQCAGTHCPRRDDCHRYVRTKFEPKKPFLSTLCEWHNNAHVDYFVPLDVVEPERVALEIVSVE